MVMQNGRISGRRGSRSLSGGGRHLVGGEVGGAEESERHAGTVVKFPWWLASRGA
jgi:hypothetical protein